MNSLEWFPRAACAGLAVSDPKSHALFFSIHERDQIRAVEGWCDRCPVQQKCEEMRERTGSEGVWAGKTDWDRGRARKQPAAGVNRTVANCTEPGRKRSVDRHQSLGEPLCLPCALYDNEQARLARVEQVDMFDTYPDPKDPTKRVVAA